MISKFNRVALYCLLALALSLDGLRSETLVGTVYANQSGPSGAGTGSLRLATKLSVFELYFQKPIPGRRPDPICRDLGAYWEVTAKIIRPGQGNLIDATCQGKVDEEIHSAWLRVIELLNLASAGSFSKTDGLRNEEWRSLGYSNRNLKLQDLDLSSYMPERNAGDCLEVYEKFSASRVIIQISENCHIWFEGKPATINVIVTKEGADWKIGPLILVHRNS